MMIQNQLYKHKRCTDMAIEVKKTTHATGGIIVLARYINIAHKRMFEFPVDKEFVYISSKDMQNWELYEHRR